MLIADNTRWQWLYRATGPVLLVILIAVAGFVYRTELMSGMLSGYGSQAFAIILAVFLSFLPVMICLVQNTTRRRQLSRLNALSSFKVSSTTYYRVALMTADSEQTGAVNADFGPPLFVYFFIVLASFLACLLGDNIPGAFRVPSFLLSGLHLPSEPDFESYQTKTFCVIAVAFLASYVYAMGRLLDRVNNNDLYPISLYYYAVRVVIACSAAAVLRHTATVFTFGENTPLLLLLGFAIGFAPDLFIVAMSRRAFQAMKIWGTRDDPPAAARPPGQPLLMIDDLGRDKIDRLDELGIDSAQVLSRQNPFLLLIRLPYDLGLIIDWIAQAQLYVLVGDDALRCLRGLYVRNIFDLAIRLRNPTARGAVCRVLKLADADAEVFLEQITADPTVMRLSEVRRALLPDI